MTEPMFVSYPQNFEDVMLWRALGHIEAGCYIDIGAQDPVVDSVSLAFHERGWVGLHVEPTMHYAAMLREQRPGDVVLQAAVGEHSGVMTLFEFGDTGLSTLDAGIAADAVRDGFSMRESVALVVPLATVLETWPDRDIHWMKLDIEGFELQALRGWGDCPARPWIVVIESTLPRSQEQTHAAWEPLVLARGYRFVYFDGLNRYYVAAAHEELTKAFAAPPNIFDDFAMNSPKWLNRFIVARHEEERAAERAQSDAHVAATLETEHERHAAELADIAALLDAERRSRAEVERASTERSIQSHQELEVAREALLRQSEERAARERTFSEKLEAKQADAARHLAVVEADHRSRADTWQREHAAERAANAATQSERERFFAEQARACEALLRDQLFQVTRYAETLAEELDRMQQSWPLRLINLFASTRSRAARLSFAGAQTSVAANTATSSTLEELAMSNDPYTVRVTAHADDLLALHDTTFVRSAYLTILGRPADPTGLAGLVQQLRSGADKEQLLASLALSEEGKAAKSAAELPGLAQLVDRARRARPSIAVRALRRLMMSLLRPLANHVRDIDGQLHELSQSVNDRFERLETTLSGLKNGLVSNASSTSDEREALRQTSAHGREIYFRLRDAATWNARVAVS